MANKIRAGDRVDVDLVEPFLSHKFPEASSFSQFMLRVAGWLTLFFASVLVIFPEVGEYLIGVLPSFLLLSERAAKALDYVWGLVGKPVGKQHLMYHMPNIIIYAFGVAGVRQLWRRINRDNWRDHVEDAQEKLTKAIAAGTGRFAFPDGFSLMFTGEGDQVAKNLIMDDHTIGPTLSSKRPLHTNLWGKFDNAEGDEGFIRVLDQFNSEDAGEYVLFPVVDEHLFLPGLEEFDIPPHRVEIAVRRIREYEKQKGWAPKKTVIVGDKEQQSKFITTSKEGEVPSPNDEVSLRTIAAEYENVTIADPTDITLSRIIEIAEGRQILFRASDHGTKKYSNEFYHRLSLLGYEPTSDDKLVIGYDITDLETEHQVVSQKHTAYLPVILSRDVFDLLSKHYLRDNTYIFVPALVKQELKRLVTGPDS
ncbi:hypothetical protein C1J03_19925 [Sulfitobacter sp. SK012]|nr:hypothetical protein C1J03_19925 [Sulfitobacter sp. SK012]